MSDVVGLSAEHLRQYIEKIERLEEEKTNLLIDISEIFKDAKSNGFDVKIMRVIIRLRKMDKNALMEQESLIDLYKQALGMELS
jgi:uncharacterized protein (UPF0335 family)